MSRFVCIFAVPLRWVVAVVVFATLLVVGGGVTHLPVVGAPMVRAQEAPTFKILYSFNSGHGAFPFAVLTTPAGVLYGTATGGGCADCSGLVFKIVLSTTNSANPEYVLHTFGGGSDGYMPEGGLVRDSYGNVYGTTLGCSALPRFTF